MSSKATRKKEQSGKKPGRKVENGTKSRKKHVKKKQVAGAKKVGAKAIFQTASASASLNAAIQGTPNQAPLAGNASIAGVDVANQAASASVHESEDEQQAWPQAGQLDMFGIQVEEPTDGLKVVKDEKGVKDEEVFLGSGFLEQIAIGRTKNMLERGKDVSSFNQAFGEPFQGGPNGTLPNEKFFLDYLDFLELSDYVLGADKLLYDVNVASNTSNTPVVTLMGKSRNLIGTALGERDDKEIGFSTEVNPTIEPLKQALETVLGRNGRFAFAASSKIDDWEQLPSNFPRGMVEKWFPAQQGDNWKRDSTILSALDVAHRMFADMNKWDDDFVWNHVSSGSALGQFVGDIATHKGGVLNYRGAIGNRSWQRDAVATLVHEMGHKMEYNLDVVSMVQLYRSLLSRTKSEQLIIPLSGQRYRALDLFLPNLPEEEIGQPITGKPRYAGTITQEGILNMMKSQSTEFLSTTAEELVNDAEMSARSNQETTELPSLIEKDPLRVALFLKFANPNYYQAVSKEFENQIRSEHPEGKVPSLDKILHVDLLRDVSKK